jgi:hypothetical protein
MPKKSCTTFAAVPSYRPQAVRLKNEQTAASLVINGVQPSTQSLSTERLTDIRDNLISSKL